MAPTHANNGLRAFGLWNVCPKQCEKRNNNLLGYIPMPEGPFRHLVIDYVGMIKSVVASSGHRSISSLGWSNTVKRPSVSTVKFLIQEIVHRFGIPLNLSSDNRSAFVQKVSGTLQKLTMNQRLGFFFHLQSQGMLERVNGVKNLC